MSHRLKWDEKQPATEDQHPASHNLTARRYTREARARLLLRW